ncbi:MAG: TonB-dependent receptor [Planctomycetes bacterium]|nr:TonB-dependent receptor [Planctomycetota bacterium]
MNAGKNLLLRMVWLLVLGLFDFAEAGASAGTEPNQPRAEENYLDMSIEELMDVSLDTVQGASKYAQKLRSAPASVTIVTGDEIRQYGYRTLAEVLRSVPGFYLNYDRNYHYLGTRGFRRPGDYDSRILLLVDGHRVNENIGGGLPSGTHFPLDVDLIEKVEVIRGPGSALYGSNALLAVINVVTKQGRSLDGVELSGSVGNLDTCRGRVTYGEQLREDVDVLLSGTAYKSGGRALYFREFDAPETNHGWVDNDDDQFQDVAARVSWGDFSFLLARSDREKGIPTAPWGVLFGDPRTRTWDTTTLVGLTYDRALSETWAIKGRVSYGHYDYDGAYAYDYAEEGEDPRVVLFQDEWRGRWWEGELQLVGRPLERHTLSAGTEVAYHARQDQRAWDEVVWLDDARNSQNWGVYVQDEYRPWKNLALVGGVRHDNYDSFGGTTNPRLGLIYDPFEQTTLKLLYGTAFRAPTAYELYYESSTEKASLDMEPETITTYEAVVEQQFTRVFRGTVSGFSYAMENLIDHFLDPADGLLVFRNLDEVQARGVELAVDARWETGWQSRLSYTYVHAADEATGQALVDSPKHLAKLHILAPLVRQRLFAGLEILYDSEAKTLGGRETEEFVLTNLTLTYVSPARHLEVFASVYNLGDTHYAYPGFGEHVQDTIAQDGRAYRVGLTYRF